MWSRLAAMSSRTAQVNRRTQAISRHMASATTSTPAEPEEPLVQFESKQALRIYNLNRPKKLNSLNEAMLNILRPKIEEWSRSDLCGTIVGTGTGRAFCAGGDVRSVVENAEDPKTRKSALDFFKKEYEMDYILASLPKPYVAVLNGITMGGGVGLAAHAPFRIATENTVFSMPENKIGFFPDVGASYFMSRLDGELGTYLALTSTQLKGREVFEAGFATHFISSRSLSILFDHLSALEPSKPDLIDRTIEDLSAERQSEDASSTVVGAKRAAIDRAFRHSTVEEIISELEALKSESDQDVAAWATETLAGLHERSPTSLKVALQAIRKGKDMSLLAALQMELNIATAYCSGASPDFKTGVFAVLVDKIKERPAWSPNTVKEVEQHDINLNFFSDKSPFIRNGPRLSQDLAGKHERDPMRYGLPAEKDIQKIVDGSHSTSGATGVTLEELINKVQALSGGKHGVKEKVIDVVQRRCTVVDNADGNFVWLKWKAE